MTISDLSSLFVSHFVQAQMGPGSYMHGNGYGMSGGWGIWMLLQGLIWIGLLVAIVLGIVFLMRRRSDNPPERPHSSALDQLDERYARGEIDREEYLQCKQDISER